MLTTINNGSDYVMAGTEVRGGARSSIKENWAPRCNHFVGARWWDCQLCYSLPSLRWGRKVARLIAVSVTRRPRHWLHPPRVKGMLFYWPGVISSA